VPDWDKDLQDYMVVFEVKGYYLFHEKNFVFHKATKSDFAC
jgi:hypothetical protein